MKYLALGLVLAAAACGPRIDYNQPLTSSEIAAERADAASRGAPTDADRAQCEYEAVAASSAQPGILLPAFEEMHLRAMCLRARAAAHAAGEN